MKKTMWLLLCQHNGKTTDKLIGEEQEITFNPNKREHDCLVSVGEQITISKLCMCLNEKGINSISLTGWQIPIVTDNNFGDANIKFIGTERIKKELSKGNVVVIAGFQGIDDDKNITTLGRGRVRYYSSCYSCQFKSW